MSKFGNILDVKISPKSRNATIAFACKDDALRALKFVKKQSSVLATLGGHRKPTQHVYMHRIRNDPAMTTFTNVEETLSSLGFSKDSWSTILVSKNHDYALLQFESVADALDIFYTLKNFVSEEWVLDFEPLNVSCRHFVLLFCQMLGTQLDDLLTWTSCGCLQERTNFKKQLHLYDEV